MRVISILGLNAGRVVNTSMSIALATRVSSLNLAVFSLDYHKMQWNFFIILSGGLENPSEEKMIVIAPVKSEADEFEDGIHDSTPMFVISNVESVKEEGKYLY